MFKRKSKLLAIAPSESVRSQLCELAAAIDHIEMDSYVGNLYSAVEIVQQRLSHSDDYDVILSRGETASMIKKITEIPVIEFPLSFYDVLHAIKLADNFNEPYAIVGFTPVANAANMLRDLLQLDLDIYTLFTLADAAPTMEQLKEKGYNLIVSGMGIDAIARRNGINSILITTGRDTLCSALDQAVRLCNSMARLKERQHFLSQLLANSDQEILVFDKNRQLVFSSIKAIKKEQAIAMATKRLQLDQHTDSLHLKTTEDMLISISEKNIVIDDEPYTVFYFDRHKKPYASPRNEIRIFSRIDAVNTFLYHYLELSSSEFDSDRPLPQAIRSAYPIMLTGENGVGKEQIAATIYAQGKYQNHPYIVIDFALATEKTWSFLINHVSSPINSAEITIYFRGLEKLTPTKVDKLKAIVSDSGSHRRNKIIFSYTTTPGKPIPPHITSLTNQFSCLTIYTPPLRKRASEIHALAALYVSTINIDLAKQVIGFTPQAMELMEQYQWPGNLTQFKRVITQLMTNATSSYIQEEHVRRILDVECSGPEASFALSDILNLNKPLQEIEKDIAKAVLAETGGNQSQAAARLGICRTTLWRMIKES